MGMLDNVEKGIERAVRGVFSRGSKVLQPVEMASALRRELDDKAMTLAAGRTLAPNVFSLQLGDTDFDRARSWGTPLAEELCDVVIGHARSQGYILQGPVRVSFNHDAELKPGHFEVTSSTERGSGAPEPEQKGMQQNRTGHDAPSGRIPAAPLRHPAPPTAAPQPVYARPPAPAPTRRTPPGQPVLDINGQRYSLNADSIVLGRSSEADVLVDDTGVSRRHLEIRTEDGVSTAVDLGSTNGSFVDGHRVHGTAPLSDGSTITMGRTTITFRILPARPGGRT